MTLAKSPKHKQPKKGKHVKGLTSSELELPPAKLFEKRFKDMNDYFGWVESTKNTYSSRLANLLPYLPDIPFCYCLYDDYDRAVKAMASAQKKAPKKGRFKFDDDALGYYHTLINDLCRFAEANSNGRYHNTLWGTGWLKVYPTAKQKEQVHKERPKLRRSLTISQELSLLERIRDNCLKDGFYLGLAIMFYMGIRPGECCGLKFEDIKPLAGCEEEFNCLYVHGQVRTDNTYTSTLKTQNAYRVLPIPEELNVLLNNRRNWIRREYNVDPASCFIVCKENSLSGIQEHCPRQRFDLFCTETVRTLNFKEDELDALCKEGRNSEEQTNRSVTGYLLRRNFATALAGVCGMNRDELEYEMGHSILNTEEARRDFLNPDMLYHLWKKLNRRHYLYTIEDKQREADEIIWERRNVTIQINGTMSDRTPLVLQLKNAYPNDYIKFTATPDAGDHVTASSKKDASGVQFRLLQLPVQMGRAGRIPIDGDFEKAVATCALQKEIDPYADIDSAMWKLATENVKRYDKLYTIPPMATAALYKKWLEEQEEVSCEIESTGGGAEATITLTSEISKEQYENVKAKLDADYNKAKEAFDRKKSNRHKGDDEKLPPAGSVGEDM